MFWRIIVPSSSGSSSSLFVLIGLIGLWDECSVILCNVGSYPPNECCVILCNAGSYPPNECSVILCNAGSYPPNECSVILCNAGSYPPNNSVTSQKISIFNNTLQDLTGHQSPPQCSKFKHFTDLMHCQSLVSDSSSLPINLITFSHHVNIRLYHLPNATAIQILLYTYTVLKLSTEISVASQ